ncbi:FitA-like ribbon-helix-helix domain-containing protein [Amycolatopsis alkalitolerans]|uniref:Toxin-antitoxin system HicB family antitoxin n=1 Tax=Amycolatopsis alkalitolerans TaxID=2547244 RepID=A0A5C4LRC7_9PSEU|nr:toxin-antitoxin system HicB family antitoxin [Amycolatopsis alkalitolerans]TNC21278.1 toxin-antitoxin system HicB family antitoxin [Amycolatopsis alkalitolerans]
MRQMIARLDDDLHARVKAKAEAEGRSMNEFVVETLKAAVDKEETREEWRKRMLAAGKVIVFEPENPAPGRDELEKMSRGWGTAVSEALDWTRGDW